MSHFIRMNATFFYSAPQLFYCLSIIRNSLRSMPTSSPLTPLSASSFGVCEAPPSISGIILATSKEISKRIYKNPATVGEV